MSDTAIFLGPTLARRDAERILDADYLPPVCRGDLARLPADIRFVGIIDGEFYQSLSVSPKEIVTLLRRGITVCGASSMGALRAAETHTLGTIGVGKIFAMYRDGILDADDEVALVYEPETFRKLSEPLVNLRAALSLAFSAGIITAQQHRDLLLHLKSLYFPDRSYNTLYTLCPTLRTFFTRTPPPDPKRDDALALLHTLHRLKQGTVIRSERPPSRHSEGNVTASP